MILAAFGTLAASMVVLAIIGGVRGWSPVPLADMWGSIWFYLRHISGEEGIWWAQHNEHRILIARLLFWMDHGWFDGTGWPLMITNYLVVFTSFLIFTTALREQLGKDAGTLPHHLLSLTILALLFFWGQSENLLRPFQISFFLAHMLPMAALFLLHLSITNSSSRLLFPAACLAGITAAGSMANGLLTLPLMVVMAIVMQVGKQRIAILIALSLFVAALYLRGYQTPPGHTSVTDVLLSRPGELTEYVLLYLGGPIHSILGDKVVAQSAGLFLLVDTAVLTWLAAKRPLSSIRFVLLAFLFYVIASALATAGGRLDFGMGQALSSRYQTPVIMAWCALLVLHAPALAQLLAGPRNQWSIAALFLFTASLLPVQLKALDSQRERVAEHFVSALAIELGIPDERQISHIFPVMQPVLTHGKYASMENLSVFSHPLLKDIREQIGQPAPAISLAPCLGHIDTVSEIEIHPPVVRVVGWVFRPDEDVTPGALRFVNDKNHTVGYALTGFNRPDVATRVHRKAAYSGFKGYLLKEHLGAPLSVQGIDPDCTLEVVPLNMREIDLTE